MTIVAFANVLLVRAPRRWGLGDARIEAVASLLHERAPREVPGCTKLRPSDPRQPSQARSRVLRDVMPGMAAIEPTHLLSNGRYAVTLPPTAPAPAAGAPTWCPARARRPARRLRQLLHLRWDRQRARSR